MSMIDPGQRLSAVTPSDSATLSGVRALYVGAAGNVAVKCAGMSAAVTLVGVQAGSLLPIRATQVMSTDTTAGSIVAVY